MSMSPDNRTPALTKCVSSGIYTWAEPSIKLFLPQILQRWSHRELKLHTRSSFITLSRITSNIFEIVLWYFSRRPGQRQHIPDYRFLAPQDLHTSFRRRQQLLHSFLSFQFCNLLWQNPVPFWTYLSVPVLPDIFLRKLEI